MSADAPPEGVSGRLLAADRGPRFAAWVGRPAGPPFVAAAELFGAGVTDAVSAVMVTRRAANRAVAGALLFEGYVARIVPPVLAALLTESRAPVVEIGGVWVEWRDGRVGAVALEGPVEPAGRGDDVVAALMERNLRPALDAVHRNAGTGRRVLRGAAAHVVTVAALHLSWPDPQPARYLDDAVEVLERWGVADLVGIGTRSTAGERWLYAERRSCCLAFRAGDRRERGVSFCVTCPVTPEADRHRSFSAAATSFRERQHRAREPTAESAGLPPA
jgi:hypothetical protein